MVKNGFKHRILSIFKADMLFHAKNQKKRSKKPKSLKYSYLNFSSMELNQLKMHLKTHMGKNSGTIHQYDFLCFEKMFKRSHSIVIPPHILTVFNLNLLLEQRFVVTYVIPILDSLGFGLLVPFQNLFPCCLAAKLIKIINDSLVF